MLIVPITLLISVLQSRNPTPETSEFLLWSPAGSFPLDHMVIGNKNGLSEKLMSLEKDLFPERVKFWKRLRKDFPMWLTLTSSDIKDEL